MGIVRLEHLHDLVRELFVSAGLTVAESTQASDAVIYADSHGFTTHGLNAVVNIYVPRLLSGRISKEPRPSIVRTAPSVALIDGKARLGMLTGTEAVDLASSLAQEQGIGAVAVRNSSHFGCAGFYSARAAGSGLIGFAFSNCGAQGVVPPLAGARRLFGTNPLSAAVPTQVAEPFILDMSSSSVATGRLWAAYRDGQQVPPGLLIRPDGSGSTDPEDYVRGRADVTWLGGRLETGAAKGFGLGVLVEVLAGALAGAAMGPSHESLVGEQPDDDVGHLFICLDPAAFVGAEAFVASVDRLLECTTACPPASWAKAVTYPGQLESIRAREALQDGVRVPLAVLEGARQLAARLRARMPPVADEGAM